MLTLPGAAPLLLTPMSTSKGTHLSGSQSPVDTSRSSPKPQVRNSISLPESLTLSSKFPRDPHDLFSELLGQQLLFGAVPFLSLAVGPDFSL